jgi:hypothetical protein
MRDKSSTRDEKEARAYELGYCEAIGMVVKMVRQKVSMKG